MTETSNLLTNRIEADTDTLADTQVRHYGSIQQPQDDSSDLAQPMDENKTTLRFFDKIGFSLGHIYNDLCAGVWFSYTLLFMQGVLQIPGPQAGALVMLGQVGDASKRSLLSRSFEKFLKFYFILVATPIVGILTDKFSTKRKWHIFGKFSKIPSIPILHFRLLF